MERKYDVCGWATKNDLLCTDGRIIDTNAFAHQDGKKVPLVYMHKHDDPDAVIGHAILENRKEGVYAYGYLNNTKKAQTMRELLSHGDIDSFSIWANRLNQDGHHVKKGDIVEVSLVIGGKNPGAFVESVLQHGMAMDDYDEECYLYTGEPIVLAHADDKISKSGKEESKTSKDEKGETLQEVFDTLNEKQKALVFAMVNEAFKYGEEKETDMKQSVFNQERDPGTVLSHADIESIYDTAMNLGSMKRAIAQHTVDGVLQHSKIDSRGMVVGTADMTYGVDDPSLLLPDGYHNVGGMQFISREMGWVTDIMNGITKTPFMRIKSQYADITEDDARARGYIKGKQKKEEVFALLKRTTEPQTIYKKQKLDRDDILDAADDGFDFPAFVKSEMDVMLDEEHARAILIGDGRAADSDDKIKPDRIRPVATDNDLFTIKAAIDHKSSEDDADFYKRAIDSIIKARGQYKGSGDPILFTTDDMISGWLLLETKNGEKLYKTMAELATTLRVKKIVAVEVMSNTSITVDSASHKLLGVIFNPRDYAGGGFGRKPRELFSDFDIDFNQEKYLLERRTSGALIKPYSAISLYEVLQTQSGNQSGTQTQTAKS